MPKDDQGQVDLALSEQESQFLEAVEKKRSESEFHLMREMINELRQSGFSTYHKEGDRADQLRIVIAEQHDKIRINGDGVIRFHVRHMHAPFDTLSTRYDLLRRVDNSVAKLSPKDWNTDDKLDNGDPYVNVSDLTKATVLEFIKVLNWYRQQIATSHRDDRYSAELLPIADAIETEGYFGFSEPKDDLKRKLREIVQRRGQSAFRENLIHAYSGCCAVTDCNAVEALEAAHIIRYSGHESNHPSNGLLLRADIHTLFDLQLIGINPEERSIVIAEPLIGSNYEDLEGRTLKEPVSTAFRPTTNVLKSRWDEFHGAK